MFITDQIEQFVATNHPDSKSFYTKLSKLLFKNSILQESGYRCIYCSNLATTLDHIICKNSGGQHLQSNLVGACSSCNTSKATTYWKTWYKQQQFYNKQSEQYICKKLATRIHRYP